MKLPTPFGPFSRSQALVFRMPWLALGTMTGFLVFVGCIVQAHQLQLAVTQAIASKAISLAQVDQQIASVMALLHTGVFTFLAFTLVGVGIEVLAQKKLVARYRTHLSGFDFSTLGRFARGLETDETSRWLAIHDLSLRQPGWSYK